MKKTNHRLPLSSIMVNARFDYAWCLQGIIEDLANEKIKPVNNLEMVTDGWRGIGTSSIEAGIGGNFIFSDNDLHKHFRTAFVFVCVRMNGEKHKLEWSSSLS